jgi:PIN domain nuclease of toxin-antitoxin system
MAEAVLDASAVLALFQGEVGASMVAEALPGALLSSVNASEAVTKMIRYGSAPDAAVDIVRKLKCPIVPVDDRLGLRAGVLYALTAGFGLSLGDRICLALAEREGLPVMTADRAWASLDIGVEIRLIR